MYLQIASREAMERLGLLLAAHLYAPSVVFLRGDLGAGKTTLVRAILRGRGWSETVKSPTYTLVESYPIADVQHHHFDLYRIVDPEELEFLGIRDYWSAQSICFVEWPDRGAEAMVAPDLDITINYAGVGRCAHFAGPLMDMLSDILKKSI